MRIALFGGTFDPVHAGHLAAARAAQQAFNLDQVHFVPAQTPPHKRDRRISDFSHRYAMLALACTGSPGFIPSLLEKDSGQPNYSIETIRKAKGKLDADTQLFFMVGVDSFLGIRTWKEPVGLLDACDFIIVSRPGFDSSKVAAAIPNDLQPQRQEAAGQVISIRLRRTALHLLTSVHEDVSASAIRRRAACSEPLCGLAPDSVAEYIRKTGLYRDAEKSR